MATLRQKYFSPFELKNQIFANFFNITYWIRDVFVS